MAYSRRFRSFLFIFFAIAGTAHAEIREIRSMNEVTRFIDERTLLVFDLDNTIMEPAQTLGSDQWFDYMVESFVEAGDAPVLANAKAIDLWSRVQLRTSMKAVESITPQLISSAQQNGVPVLALTARPPAFAARTEEQLRGLGVSFARRPVYRHNLPSPNPNSPQYLRGIVYVGPTVSKGDALVTFLRAAGLNPGRIVFADDKPKHVATVDASLRFSGIQHFELRYGAADTKVRSFNRQVANIQLQYFMKRGILLTDQQARSLLR